MKASLEGGNRQRKLCGDLLLRASVEVHCHVETTVGLFDLHEARCIGLHTAALPELVVRPVGGVLHRGRCHHRAERVALDKNRASLEGPELHPRAVLSHPVDPAPEGALLMEEVDLVHNREQGVVGRLFGIPLVSEHAYGDSKYAVAVGIVQGTRCVRVTAAKGLEQVSIGHGSTRCGVDLNIL